MSSTALVVLLVLAQSQAAPEKSQGDLRERMRAKASQLIPPSHDDADCRAIAFTKDEAQFLTTRGVSKPFPLEELEKRARDWRGAASTVTVLSRVHRPNPKSFDSVAEKAKRAGFKDVRIARGYVTPSKDADLREQFYETCSAQGVSFRISSLYGFPASLDAAAVASVALSCEGVAPDDEDVESVLGMCQAVSNLNPYDAAPAFTDFCSTNASCARGCEATLERELDEQPDRPLDCPSVKAALAKVEPPLRRAAENVWVFRSALCVIDAASKSPKSGRKVKEACSNGVVESIRRAMAQP